MGDYVWLPIAEITTLPDLWAVEVIRDQWWIHNGEDRVAFWRTSPSASHLAPQANRQPSIAKRLLDRCPDAKGLIILPVVYRPHHCSDYDHNRY